VKELCLASGDPASTEVHPCAKKAHGWESAEVIVGDAPSPKDLM